MPSTLVHLGVQGLLGKLLLKHIDLKWVFLGCVIPDLPWIMRRVLMHTGLDINSYDLRVYGIVQASLVFCLLLSMAFALFSTRPRLVFSILSVNCTIHLCLDSLEIKWGNGVHFLAPVDWYPASLSWLWPDSPLLALASLISLGLILLWMLKPVGHSIHLAVKPWRSVVSAACLACYFLAPFALLQGPYDADVNSVTTLKDREARVGKVLFLDRESYIRENGQDYVVTFTGERLLVVGESRASQTSEVTLSAEFIDVDKIEIIDIHEFKFSWRNFATMLGLLIVCCFWVASLWRQLKQGKQLA